MKLVLLPDWDQAPTWEGLLGNAIPYEDAKRTLREVKPDWLPQFDDAQDLSQVEAFAFPTPFAWAEMMTAVIEQKRFSHVLFQLYKNLALGLALGYLRLEIVDLQAYSFGRVLARADENYRYFGILRGRGTPEHRDLEGQVFGGTSPESLFWPAPRRSANDWAELETAINRHPHYNQAYQMLADFRDLLQGEGLWNAETVIWCRGLDEVIGTRRPSTEHKDFNMNTRTVGPIYAACAGHTLKPLYFPIYQKEFAAHFLRGLTGTLRRDAGRPGVVGVFDHYGNQCFEIANPSLPPGGDLVRAGAGTVRFLREPARDAATTAVPHLTDDDNVQGLFSLLQSLKEALRRNPDLGLDIAAVKRRPYLYPDAVRIPVARLGEAGLGQAVSFSKPAYALTYDPESPGLPLADELEETSAAATTSGFVLPYDNAQGQPQKAFYIDTYANAKVFDLRALGWVLWSYFISGSGTEPEALKDFVEISGGRLVDGEGTRLFKDTNSNRPFDFSDSVASDIYRRVRDESRKPKRLATQQRFLRAYRDLHDSDPSNLHELCYRAAQSLVHWAWPEWPGKTFLPNGHAPQRRTSVNLGHLTVTLLRDD